MLIASSGALVTNELWRQVLLAAPWLRVDAHPNMDALTIRAGLASVSREGGVLCCQCARHLMLCKPEDNFSKSALKARAAALGVGVPHDLKCLFKLVLCTMVANKVKGLLLVLERKRR